MNYIYNEGSAQNGESTLNIHQNDIVCNDSKTRRMYRLDSSNIKKITYDYREIKRFFGLKKSLSSYHHRNRPEATELTAPIEIREDKDPEFRKYMGRLRTFAEDNKIPMEIKRLDGDNTRINF